MTARMLDVWRELHRSPLSALLLMLVSAERRERWWQDFHGIGGQPVPDFGPDEQRRMLEAIADEIAERIEDRP